MSGGLYGITLSTLNEDGTVDEGAFIQEMALSFDTDVDGIVICGSTSEFIYLEEEQAFQMAEIASITAAAAFETSGIKKILIGGASAPTEHKVIRMVEKLSDLGFSQVLICPPYYFPQKKEDILTFYQEIDKHIPTGMGMLLYHIPSCAPGIDLSILPQLMELPSVTGMKDSSGDMLYHARARYISNKVGKLLFTGHDICFLPSQAVGGDGCMSAGALLLNKLHNRLMYAYKKGDMLEAQRLHSFLLALDAKLNQVPFPENYRLLAQARKLYPGKAQRRFSCLREDKKVLWLNEVEALLARFYK